MAVPPLVWTVNICTSRRAAAATDLGNGVRDVVEFQIKEHGGAGVANLFYDVRPGGGEKFAAYFKGAGDRANFAGQRQRRPGGRNIQSDNDWVSHIRSTARPGRRAGCGLRIFLGEYFARLGFGGRRRRCFAGQGRFGDRGFLFIRGGRGGRRLRRGGGGRGWG